LVRSLRAHHQPLVLSPSTEIQAGARPIPAEAKPASAPAPSTTTRVVDINSLTVEHAAPRSTWHPAPVVPKAAAVPALEDESAAAPQGDPPAAEPTASAKPKNDDLPAAAHANPYTTGTQDEAAAQ
jgi:hypothetical protein